jgi:hypothetical protein
MENPLLKKILFSMAICGLFIGFTVPVYELNDLGKYRLKGKVKSVMEIKYTAGEKADSAQKGKLMYQKYILFDINGYETESSLFESGNEYLTSKYIFGADGKQVEMNEYNSDGSLNVHVTYKYDNKGFRSQADYTWAENWKMGEIDKNTDYYYEVLQNDIYTKVMYKNEYRGYCIEETYLKADSSLSFRFVFKYDARGNKLESSYYHKSGRLSWKTKFIFDRYDNMIESRVFKSNRIAVLSKYKYQFDSAGNWVVRTEDREVQENILTSSLEKDNTVTERVIEYYE